MLIDDELMDRVDDLGCKFYHLKKVSALMEYCLLDDFYAESRHEISSLFVIVRKYLLDTCEEFGKISYELEFGKSEEQKET